MHCRCLLLFRGQVALVGVQRRCAAASGRVSLIHPINRVCVSCGCFITIVKWNEINEICAKSKFWLRFVIVDKPLHLQTHPICPRFSCEAQSGSTRSLHIHFPSLVLLLTLLSKNGLFGPSSSLEQILSSFPLGGTTPSHVATIDQFKSTLESRMTVGLWFGLSDRDQSLNTYAHQLHGTKYLLNSGHTNIFYSAATIQIIYVLHEDRKLIWAASHMI